MGWFWADTQRPAAVAVDTATTTSATPPVSFILQEDV